MSAMPDLISCSERNRRSGSRSDCDVRRGRPIEQARGTGLRRLEREVKVGPRWSLANEALNEAASGRRHSPGAGAQARLGPASSQPLHKRVLLGRVRLDRACAGQPQLQLGERQPVQPRAADVEHRPETVEDRISIGSTRVPPHRYRSPGDGEPREAS